MTLLGHHLSGHFLFVSYELWNLPACIELSAQAPDSAFGNATVSNLFSGIEKKTFYFLNAVRLMTVVG